MVPKPPASRTSIFSLNEVAPAAGVPAKPVIITSATSLALGVKSTEKSV